MFYRYMSRKSAVKSNRFMYRNVSITIIMASAILAILIVPWAALQRSHAQSDSGAGGEGGQGGTNFVKDTDKNADVDQDANGRKSNGGYGGNANGGDGVIR